MQDIEQIILLCSFRNGELECEQYKQFLKKHQSKLALLNKSSKSPVCPNLAFSVERLKATVEDFRSYFNFKINEVRLDFKYLHLDTYSKAINVFFLST